MNQNTLVEDLRTDLLRLRDERIRLDAELKTKSDLLRRLMATEENSAQNAKPVPQPTLDLPWAKAILMCVRGLGGKASLRQIYNDIGQYRKLSSGHRKETVWSRRPAFQHEVRSFISGLVKSGALSRPSRGVYEITQKGDEELSQAGWESQVWELATDLSAEKDPALAEIWSYPQDAAYDQL